MDNRVKLLHTKVSCSTCATSRKTPLQRQQFAPVPRFDEGYPKIMNVQEKGENSGYEICAPEN